MHNMNILSTTGSSKLSLLFPGYLPAKPYCKDDKDGRMLIKPREDALKHRYIQFNDRNNYQFLTHDIDHSDAWGIHAEERLPQPNVMIFNPDNSHAHAAYVIRTPVWNENAVSLKPLNWLAAIERAITRRTKADRYYAGVIAKNPYHPSWITEWRREEPYTLAEIDRWIEFEEKAPYPSKDTTCGFSRNCTIFDEVRQEAYKAIRSFNRYSNEFLNHLLNTAMKLNNFPVPLRHSELRSIAKSIAKWVSKHFSSASFSARQRAVVMKRWNRRRRHISIEDKCLVLGISRRTYFRRQARRAKIHVSA